MHRQPRPFLGALSDQALNDLLRHGLEEAEKAKATLRHALGRVAPPARPPFNRRAAAAPFVPGPRPPAGTPPQFDVNLVSEPRCEVKFETRLRLTTMRGRARVAVPLENMKPLIDPRSWGRSDGVVAAAFVVEEDYAGMYRPAKPESEPPLGTSWRNKLLYEYARSEIASFENILAIEEFSVTDDLVEARYRLYDCLRCTFGSFSAPGGLTVDEGHVRARRTDERSCAIEVLKRVQVSDLTPNDAGNRYDFGEWVNSTIGAALSEWVHDTSLLRPVF